MRERIRALLARESHGVLATLSARHDGWPFASLVAFAIARAGEPLLLLSSLAEHSRNLAKDQRASLLVADHGAAADPLAGARVTLLGTVEPVGEQDTAAARTDYLARHPSAAEYLALGDFRLYVLNVTQARYVGGFGDMGWVDRSDLNSI
jgi:putative heme iron utilization protein